REVFYVIADALEVAANRRQREYPGDGGWIGRHPREQLGEQVRVEPVDLGVGGDHAGGFLGVLRDERVERAAEVLLDERREGHEVGVRVERRQAVELESALRDARREIADALEIGHRLERHRDEPQVARYRLPRREDRLGELVDLELV